jgi:hypothetical protein
MKLGTVAGFKLHINAKPGTYDLKHAAIHSVGVLFSLSSLFRSSI